MRLFTESSSAVLSVHTAYWADVVVDDDESESELQPDDGEREAATTAVPVRMRRSSWWVPFRLRRDAAPYCRDGAARDHPFGVIPGTPDGVADGSQDRLRPDI